MVRAKTVVCREGKSIFYKAQRDIEVPNVDFLSYVFGAAQRAFAFPGLD